MKNLTEIQCEALTELESQQIEGGSEKPSTSFWHDFTIIGNAIIQGLATFSTEGGRNAGLTVK